MFAVLDPLQPAGYPSLKGKAIASGEGLGVGV